MKTTLLFPLAIFLGLCVLNISSAYAEEATAPLKVGKTIDNLQAAFNGESNAHAKYLKFAQKAEEEGYKGAARFFRAAAAGEEIHAKNHEKVIKRLGGEAKATIEPVEVKSTVENLKAALNGESYERDVMYPEFIKVAEKECVSDAVRTFRWALKAETEHAKFYKDAIDNSEAWKKADKPFYVCTNCGFVTSEPVKKCPACSEPWKEYKEVA